jgi:hypothetical protein
MRVRYSLKANSFQGLEQIENAGRGVFLPFQVLGFKFFPTTLNER